MHRPKSVDSGEQPGLFVRADSREAHRGSGGVKNFVLDTNVLLHDPHSVNRFANNHVHIPVEVLCELDRFKNEQTERGAAARTVHRFLTSIFGHDTRTVTRGAKTSGGGTVRVLVGEAGGGGRVVSPAMRRFRKVFPDDTRMDHRILLACLTLREKSDLPTILVSKDLNMQLKAMAIGLACQDYLNDKVSVEDAEEYQVKRVAVEQHELQRFASSRELNLAVDRVEGLELNEYVLLTTPESKTMPARHLGGGRLVRLAIPNLLPMPSGVELVPANAGQQCFLDALLDPNISLVTCYGQAGTGKTLLAVAAGLFLTLNKEFSGLTVSRPIVAMGDTLGYLPGNLSEKMHPWLQSIYDAFEVLMPLNPPRPDGKNRNSSERKKKPVFTSETAQYPVVKPYEKLIERGLLEIEALCYIRGRSIPNRFFVLDEAQQLTPLEAKTVVTRMSKGSKLIMVGDPGQIDNPYVDSRSNGLVYTRNRLRGRSVTAHVCLTKGERSPLAELGASLM